MSSKALVIKGVNFATNKVATVSFGEDVPCTGISLSSNSLTFTSLTPSTLTATVTPENTTDHVVWESSNENVVTVANGVVTVVGIGTATITATCGTQSATCSVNATAITIDLNDSTVFEKTNTGYFSKNSSRDYLGFTDETNGRTYYNKTNKFTYAAISKDGALYETIYGIPLLTGASSMEMKFPKAFEANRVGFINGNEQTTYSLTPTSIKRAKAYDMLSSQSTVSGDYRTVTYSLENIDSAVNAFVPSIYGASSLVASDVTGDVTIEFT